jgi:hypothetical protein
MTSGFRHEGTPGTGRRRALRGTTKSPEGYVLSDSYVLLELRLPPWIMLDKLDCHGVAAQW